MNKAQNAVLLRHRATGLVVKVHESRQLSENIAIAFERMKCVRGNELWDCVADSRSIDMSMASNAMKSN